MSKVGFITANKVKGRYYYLILKSYRDSTKKTRKEVILNLGNKDKSTKIINSFMSDPENIPDNLKMYTKEDFKKWIDYINEKENGE